MKKLDAKTVAKLTPEKRKKYEAQLKRAKRNRMILAAVIATVVIAAVCFVLSITVLFNISDIKVKEAGKHYSSEEIIIASGLDIGKNMIRTDFENAENRIKMNLPYAYDVKISKSLFDGTVIISVKDGKQSMIVKCVGGYAITDSDGKVLEIVKTLPKNTKLLKITAKNDVKAKLGNKFTFADEDETRIYNDIKTALEKAKLKDITAIDISNPNSICVNYQNRFKLKLGNDTELDRKLQEAVKIIATEDAADNEIVAEINLSILKKVYVTPVETIEETTTAVPVETTTAVSEEIEATADGEQTEISDIETTSAENEGSTDNYSENDE